GAPVITVRAATKTKARQLVAVLEAVPGGGAATIVCQGGTLLSASSKSWRLSFQLASETALIPAGARLRLTLSWTSTAQSPANVLYLAAAPEGSSLTIKSASVKLPVLSKPVSG